MEDDQVQSNPVIESTPSAIGPKKAKPPVPHKPLLILCLVGMGLFLLLIIVGALAPKTQEQSSAGTTTSDPSTSSNSYQSSGTRVSTVITYDQIMNKFGEFMTMKVGKPVDGEDNYIGTYSSTLLQIIGDKSHITNASITLINDGKDVTANYNALSLKVFLTNVFGSRADDAINYASTQITSQEDGTTYIGGCSLNVTLAASIGTVIVTVKPI